MNKGFTLIEMLVSLALAAALMTIAVAGFVHALNLQRRAFAVQAIQENASFMFDAMTKELRVSKISPPVPDTQCPSAPADTIRVLNSDGAVVRYYRSGTDAIREIDGVSTVINSSSEQVARLAFCVLGSSLGDGKQPRVTVMATLQNADAHQRASINMQTTLSARFISD